ncbi:MAG: hypothetical protein Q9227_003715 [Pyrenula ochraceoflavens]
MAKSIPSPAGLPFVGNSFDVDAQEQIASYEHLADIYGPIYKLRLKDGDVLVISDFEHFDEVCDDHRFEKRVTGGAHQVRDGLGDGLFTAFNDEPNWE